MRSALGPRLLLLLVLLLGGCGAPTTTGITVTSTVPTVSTSNTTSPSATAAPWATTGAAATDVTATDPTAGTTASTMDSATETPSTVAAETTSTSASASSTDIILATTTSTQDSGLLDVLLPRFEEQTNYMVKTIAVGSGAAIALGERGEADVVLAHAPENEREFVASGAGIDRSLVMYNDFILVGSVADPAGIKGVNEIIPALQKLATSGNGFISRGDNSGTHQLELKLWEAAGNPQQCQTWYVESGTGMGQTLQIADQRQAYTLADRATFLAWRDRVNLDIMSEADPQLLNIYHVIAVNPQKFSRVNSAGARALIDFLLAPETQTLIGEFGRDKYDQALFTPCAQNSCALANNGD